MKNKVHECHEQLRVHDMRFVQLEAMIAMILKLNNKGVRDDVDTSQGVEVHC